MKKWTGGLAVFLLLALLLPAARAAETGYHKAYLTGYPDGSIRPEEPVTKEELAQILLRLVEKRPEKLQTDSTFCDLPKSRWSYEAVSAMAGLGVLQADVDGFFFPEKTVSGKALTVALDMIACTEQGEEAFSNLAAGWTRNENTLREALQERPQLSRAELAATLNLLLCRKTEPEDQMGSALYWDNQNKEAWYYAEIREASISHSFVRQGDRERWSAVG